VQTRGQGEGNEQEEEEDQDDDYYFYGGEKEEGDDENDDDDDDEAGFCTGRAARVATLQGYTSVSGFSCPRMTPSHAATASATQRKPTVPWRS
jgi:hypothetical protein